MAMVPITSKNSAQGDIAKSVLVQQEYEPENGSPTPA